MESVQAIYRLVGKLGERKKTHVRTRINIFFNTVLSIKTINHSKKIYP